MWDEVIGKRNLELRIEILDFFIVNTKKLSEAICNLSKIIKMSYSSSRQSCV